MTPGWTDRASTADPDPTSPKNGCQGPTSVGIVRLVADDWRF
ncbi:MAG: hypothetical protein AVDCRST_MAG70-202 [uncultured Thermomicrobiales bacterium]|uniref:Uncharacterized protein n=1 Tax=uncultured Thermomicrobiales bacterium TaxID=1645740 RepID=A0A6J4U9C4_9BACT|nr:MAG: hypothetical protein AVDCRST_MAG70-202 [uncultured Thermomicrobiales bacterium]